MLVRAAVAILFTAFVSACGGSSGQQEKQPIQQSAFDLSGINNMPAGFQVIGSHGFVQIDENFVNFVFKQKGSVAVNSYPGTPGTITVTANYPMLCIRSSGYVAIRKAAVSGNTYTYTLYGSGAETISWYLFDVVPPVASAAGITVYKADGTVAFSSDYSPMRVVAAGQSASGDILDGGTSVAAPYAGNFAACLSSPKATAQTAADPLISRLVYFEGIAVGASSVFTGAVPAGEAVTGTTGRVVMQSNGGQLLLVDVSNL